MVKVCVGNGLSAPADPVCRLVGDNAAASFGDPSTA